MKSYKVYIFDLDGTITNTMVIWLDILREGLLQFGITPPDDLILSRHTHDWKEMLKLGLPVNKLNDFISISHKKANDRLADAPFHNGAYKVLLTLKKQGKRIAIYSSMDRKIFEPAIQHKNISSVAEVLVTGDDAEHRKPHPAGLLKTLSDLGIPQKEYNYAVYVGDKDTDIQAANNAGIDSILYYPPSHQLMYDLNELRAHNPTHIIMDWQELVNS